MQTEKPYWLAEAYELPFTPLDVYLVSRPLEYAPLTESLILKYFDYKGKFLDYGGGIGVFTRMMRDRGLQFYRQDKYAQNLFTQFFDISDLPKAERNFEMLTSFEVLEHLEKPFDELEEIFTLSHNVLFSTGLQPSISIKELVNWTYIAETHGQHISFFTRESMKIVAEKFNRFYYYDAQQPSLHLFSTKKIENFNFGEEYKKTLPYRASKKLVGLIDKSYNKLFRRKVNEPELESLINKDTEWVLQKLYQNSLKVKH
jgi:phage pi2 protein 07